VTEKWMTYAEAGAVFGLSPEAMRKRVKRLGWRTTIDNEGRRLLLVPEDAKVAPGGGRPDIRTGVPNPEFDRVVAELEREREARLKAEVRAAAAEGEARTLREVLQRTETALEAERDVRRTLELQAGEDARQLSHFETEALAAAAEREGARIERDQARRDQTQAELAAEDAQRDAAESIARAEQAEQDAAVLRAGIEQLQAQLDAILAKPPWWRRLLRR